MLVAHTDTCANAHAFIAKPRIGTASAAQTARCALTCVYLLFVFFSAVNVLERRCITRCCPTTESKTELHNRLLGKRGCQMHPNELAVNVRWADSTAGQSS